MQSKRNEEFLNIGKEKSRKKKGYYVNGSTVNISLTNIENLFF
jgi:hypothetical protein